MIGTILFIWFGFGILGVFFHALHEYHNTYISYGDLLNFLVGIVFGPFYTSLALIALITHSKWWYALTEGWWRLKNKAVLSKGKRNGSD